MFHYQFYLFLFNSYFSTSDLILHLSLINKEKPINTRIMVLECYYNLNRRKITVKGNYSGKKAGHLLIIIMITVGTNLINVWCKPTIRIFSMVKKKLIFKFNIFVPNGNFSLHSYKIRMHYSFCIHSINETMYSLYFYFISNRNDGQHGVQFQCASIVGLSDVQLVDLGSCKRW